MLVLRRGIDHNNADERLVLLKIIQDHRC
jgi:hypothetical protein